MRLVVKNIRFQGTNFVSWSEDEAVRKAVAAALNAVDGVDILGSTATEYDVELLGDDEDED